MLVGSIAGGAVVLLAMVLVFLRPWSRAGEGEGGGTGPQDPQEAGWDVVFNGHDLDGWNAFERIPGSLRPRPIGREGWVVEQGVLTCTDGDDGLLMLPGQFGAVEFEMEVQIPEGAGLEFHLRRKPGGGGPWLAIPVVDGNMRQFVMNAGLRHHRPGSRTPSRKGVQVLIDYFANFDAVGSLLRPAGEWNTIRIRHLPRRLEVEVNDQPAADIDLTRFAPPTDMPMVGFVAILTDDTSDGLAIRSLRARPLRRGE